jgi:2'-5' RNA ligase
MTGEPGPALTRPPAPASAVIVRTSLPAALERLRRASVENSGLGVPAHLTLLYPFVAPAQLDRGIRSRVAGVAARHAAWDYELAGRARFPDSVYVRVAPEAPFTALQRDLQAAFPEHPIYEGRVAAYVPHVTIAEGPAIGSSDVLEHRGWSALPARRRVASIEVIAPGDDGRWGTVWRVPLGRARSGHR